MRFATDWRRETWEQDELARRWKWKEAARGKSEKVVEIYFGSDHRAYLVVRSDQGCLWFLILAKKTGNKKDQDDDIDRAVSRAREIQEA